MVKISRIIKLFFILFISVLSILGLLALIAIYNYNKEDAIAIDSRYNYMLALSEKTATDAWPLKQESFNKEFGDERVMGEFRKELASGELNNNTIKTFPTSSSEIRGVIFKNNNTYLASINTDTLKINISDKKIIRHWHWYNWLGIGINKIKQETVEDVINQ